MDLSKINEIAEQTSHGLKAMSELIVGETYSITNLRKVKTKFEDRVVAAIDNDYDVFLPNRVGQYLLKQEDFFKELTEQAKQKKLNVVFRGGNYNSCHFEILKTDENANK